jgi:hypothetical protein
VTSAGLITSHSFPGESDPLRPQFKGTLVDEYQSESGAAKATDASVPTAHRCISEAQMSSTVAGPPPEQRETPLLEQYCVMDTQTELNSRAGNGQAHMRLRGSRPPLPLGSTPN